IHKFVAFADRKGVVGQYVVSPPVSEFNTGNNDVECRQSFLPLQPAHAALSGNVSRICGLQHEPFVSMLCGLLEEGLKLGFSFHQLERCQYKSIRPGAFLKQCFAMDEGFIDEQNPVQKEEIEH